MRRFARLFTELDRTTRTTVKVEAIARYAADAPAADAAWAVWFLAGAKLKRLVTSTELRRWAAEEAGLPEWLVEESYSAVGDLAETIALLLPSAGDGSDLPLHRLVAERLEPLAALDEDGRRELVVGTWRELDDTQRLVFNKIVTGSFRVGVSKGLVVRALARASGAEPAAVAGRLAGRWAPSADGFRALLDPDAADADPIRPYPFFLAHPIDDPATLGPIGAWQAEWKWDGIRAQLVRRGPAIALWSRGEELITERFPEIAEATAALPDGTVLDGELLGWRDGTPLPFSALQRRIGRTRLGPKILAEVPVALVAYDLLEGGGEDLRERPLGERRARLEEIVGALPPGLPFAISPLVEATGWEELADLRAGSRERRVEGLMLKRRSSPYRTGRPRGDWWKWKIDPLEVDAVLIYAQRGHGRRASLYTDYTFGVWDRDELVPVAKAYSGLTDDEIAEVDRFVRRHTRERFGPVRAVDPELVFTLHFDGIRPSTRHKSGLAVRFPRMHRWRRDKKPEAANTLADLKELLDLVGG